MKKRTNDKNTYCRDKTFSYFQKTRILLYFLVSQRLLIIVLNFNHSFAGAPESEGVSFSYLFEYFKFQPSSYCYCIWWICRVSPITVIVSDFKSIIKAPQISIIKMLWLTSERPNQAASSKFVLVWRERKKELCDFSLITKLIWCKLPNII